MDTGLAFAAHGGLLLSGPQCAGECGERNDARIGSLLPGKPSGPFRVPCSAAQSCLLEQRAPFGESQGAGTVGRAVAVTIIPQWSLRQAA